MGPIEAAFSWGEHDNTWHARVTWKCPICGRRNNVLKTGPGALKENLPISVKCKLGHESFCKPYRT